MTSAYGDPSPRAGQVIGGKWRLTRRIGEGGMGEVYEAQHSFIGRRFAIKFLHPFLTQNPEAMTRFQHEAQAAGGIEHENIGAALDFGTADDGTPYLVMEYLDGEDLARLLVRTGPLAIPRAAYIIIQACRGLAAAHGRGIVHRDLKPENLFICRRVDGSDQVKVVDFGIAKLRTQVTVTQSGTTMGTPCYMSLEQARGAKEVDHRTDIYALGVILYEAIAGAKPYPGEAYNEVLYNLFTSEAVPLDTLRPGIDPRLSATVHRAMAREASARFNSVQELAEALVAHAGRPVTPLASQVGLAAGIPAEIPERLTTPAPVVPTAVDITPAPAPVAVTPPKRDTVATNALIRSAIPSRAHRWVGAAVGAVVLTGPLTYGAWWLVRGDRQAAGQGGGLPKAEQHSRPAARSSEAAAAPVPAALPPSSAPQAAIAPPAASPAALPASPAARGTKSPEDDLPGQSKAVAVSNVAKNPARSSRRHRHDLPPLDSKASPAMRTAPPAAKPEYPTAATKTDSRPAPGSRQRRSFDPYPEE
jgi:tRNA A-37 threonylcarbamoyl transferase component Bud32